MSLQACRHLDPFCWRDGHTRMPPLDCRGRAIVGRVSKAIHEKVTELLERLQDHGQGKRDLSCLRSHDTLVSDANNNDLRQQGPLQRPRQIMNLSEGFELGLDVVSEFVR